MSADEAASAYGPAGGSGSDSGVGGFGGCPGGRRHQKTKGGTVAMTAATRMTSIAKMVVDVKNPGAGVVNCTGVEFTTPIS